MGKHIQQTASFILSLSSMLSGTYQSTNPDYLRMKASVMRPRSKRDDKQAILGDKRKTQGDMARAFQKMKQRHEQKS